MKAGTKKSRKVISDVIYYGSLPITSVVFNKKERQYIRKVVEESIL